MIDEPELLPCPFCGRIPLLAGDDFALWWVRCDPCDIEMAPFAKADIATAAWNRRASGWTSVEDALPELDLYWIDGSGNPVLYSGEVLVCKAGAWKALATYDEKYGWITDAGDRPAGVTHWMYAEPPSADAQDD